MKCLYFCELQQELYVHNTFLTFSIFQPTLLHRYQQVFEELTIVDGLVFRGEQLIIPQALQEETLKDKFDDGDKDKIEKAVQGALDCLETHQLTAKDECQAIQEELEGVVNPM